MFSVPYTFANEDESYITIPALKRFAREKKNEDLKTTVDRPQLLQDIENYANQSPENETEVLDWLDQVLVEGIKDVQIKLIDDESFTTSFLKHGIRRIIRIPCNGTSAQKEDPGNQIKSIHRFCDNHIKNIKQTYGAKHDPSCNSPVLLLFVFCGSYFTPVRKQPNLRSLFLNLFLTFPSFSARIKSELKTRLRGNQICTE